MHQHTYLDQESEERTISGAHVVFYIKAYKRVLARDAGHKLKFTSGLNNLAKNVQPSVAPQGGAGAAAYACNPGMNR
jgi:hypothetical protein